MLYQILLGASTYCVGAGALSWWLGGIFKRERAALGLTVDQLRNAQQWSAARQTMCEQTDASVVANAIASPYAQAHDGLAHRHTA